MQVVQNISFNQFSLCVSVMRYNISKLKVLFYVSKLFGYIPFNLTNDGKFAYPSKSSVLYNIAYTICIAIMLVLCENTKYILMSERESKTIAVVRLIGSILSSIRIVWGFCVQIYQRNNIIFCINFIKEIRETIAQTKVEEMRLNKDCQSLMIKKMKIIIFEFIFIGAAISFYIKGFQFECILECIVHVLKISYIFILNILFSTLYFTASIVILQFYANLNHRLADEMKRIRVISNNPKKNINIQRYCDISDSIDHLAVLHGKLTILTNKINAIFSFQILFAIIMIFIFNLHAVNCFFYNFFFLENN